jgi:hypothetical protein
MGERRSLTDGLKAAPPPLDHEVAKRFIHGDKAEAIVQPQMHKIARMPLSTRIRSDFFAALKRASLERQLEGKEPNTLIEILEEAVEPWLKSNGYF